MKHKKTVLIVVLAVVLVGSVIFVAAKKKRVIAVESQKDSGTVKKVYSAGTNVNLRKGPGIGTDILKNVLSSGTLLGTADSTVADKDGIKKGDGSVYQWVKVFPDASLGVQEAFYVREDLFTLK